MSDADILRFGLMAVGVALVINAVVRFVVALADWHWRRCPRNPDRRR